MKRGGLTAFGLLLVFLVPVVAGLVTVENVDDFESYAPETVEPSQEWYDWVLIEADLTVTSNSMGNGAQSLEADPDVGGAGATVQLTTPAPYNTVSFTIHPNGGTSDVEFVQTQLFTDSSNRIDRTLLYQSGRLQRNNPGDPTVTLQAVGACVVKPVTFEYTLDFGAKTFDLEVMESDGSTCHSESATAFDDASTQNITFIDFTSRTAGDVTYWIDDLTFIGAFRESPAGVRGTVETTGATDEVLVEFSLSPDDPDDTGSLSYSLERDSVEIHTTTAGDATNRVYSFLDSFAGSGDVVYRVRVTDPNSEYSCTITVDVDVQDDQDSCGNLAPSGTGGDFFGPNGIFYGGDKESYAETWQLTQDGLDALYGVGMVLFFAGLGFVITRSPMITGFGGAAGIIFALVFGLFPLWVIFFLVIIAAALFYGLRGGNSG